METKIWLWIGIGLALFILLGAGFYYWTFQGIYNKPAFGIKDYYDAQGRKLTGEEQVMINGVPGIKYVTFQVNALNEDEVPLTVEIIDASPAEFKDKLPVGVKKTVQPDDTASWVSGLVDMSSYVGQSPQFSVTVKATSTVRKDAIRTNSLTIEVVEDPEGQFSVELTNGGNEDPGIEPNPGVPPTSSIRFRTSALNYPSSGAVAYAATCGQPLTQYGYVSTQSSSGYTCDSANGMISKSTQCGANPVKVIPIAQGGWTGYGGTPSVWQGSDPTKICVCQNENDGSGYKFAYYATTDSDASKVSNSAKTVDGTMEVAC